MYRLRHAGDDGEIEVINRFDLTGDGRVDLVLPNAHGYAERVPTWIHKCNDGGEWQHTALSGSPVLTGRRRRSTRLLGRWRACVEIR